MKIARKKTDRTPRGIPRKTPLEISPATPSEGIPIHRNFCNISSSDSGKNSLKNNQRNFNKNWLIFWKVFRKNFHKNCFKISEKLLKLKKKLPNFHLVGYGLQWFFQIFIRAFHLRSKTAAHFFRNLYIVVNKELMSFMANDRQQYLKKKTVAKFIGYGLKIVRIVL